jgi:PKD repeat protein
MKKILFGFIFFMSVVSVLGQCSIDYTYFPPFANYGLSPDPLPDGYVGQFYDEDMTFVLPLDTLSSGQLATFTDFHITSISLPLGLTWECNSSANGCHYDPAVDQYGCVNVSGFPLMAGIYDAEVNLVATHDFSWLTGPENISFILPLTILPDTSTSSNTGFAMSNPVGCAPFTVGFTNNNPGMLSYFWDFGNQTTSVLENPDSVTYNDAGTYLVQYSAEQTISTYLMQSIEVLSGQCSDGGISGDPDFFYTVSTPAGVLEQVTCSNQITQLFPLNINSFSSLELTGQSVTIDLKDDDTWITSPSCTSIEDCGSFSFTPTQQAGIHSANGGGLSLNYTVLEVPANTITSTDTIYVYDYPAVPLLVYDPLNNSLSTGGGFFAMQWYYNDSPIPGATDVFINPTASGEYYLVVINEYGCATSSAPLDVLLKSWDCDPSIGCYDPGTGSGAYLTVAACEADCQNTAINEEILGLLIYPNPVSNRVPLTIYIENAEFSEATIVLMDLYGREVIRRVVDPSIFPYQFSSQEISMLSNGLYYLDISFDENKIRKKIIKTETN